MSSFLYGIKQGIKNVFRNRLFSLASIGTSTAFLFIFGIFYCMVMNFQHIFSEVETTVGVTVFFNEGVEENQILDIKSQIEQREEVDNVHYTSPEEAWEPIRPMSIPSIRNGALTKKSVAPRYFIIAISSCLTVIPVCVLKVLYEKVVSFMTTEFTVCNHPFKNC